MTNSKRDLSYPQNNSRAALLLGGGDGDGFLVGWFKTAKHRFGLHRFGQGTLVGVYRWLVLSLIAYILAPKSLFIKWHHQFT